MEIKTAEDIIDRKSCPRSLVRCQIVEKKEKRLLDRLHREPSSSSFS